MSNKTMSLDAYTHSMCASLNYNTKETLILFEKILKCNKLLSRRKQGKEPLYINYAGADYISLADLRKKDDIRGKIDNDWLKEYYNTYLCITTSYVSIVFPAEKLEKDIVQPVILRDYINKEVFRRYPYFLDFMIECGKREEERYTDFPDEVQVKDEISLEHMSSLLIPTHKMMNFWLKDSKNLIRIKEELEKYKELLYKYNKDVPFYDSKTFHLLESDEDILSVIDQLKPKNKLLRKLVV